MKKKEIKLIIAKKQNAELYKTGIKMAEVELNNLNQEKELAMSSEKKQLLSEKILEKQEELKRLNETYNLKVEIVNKEIQKAKEKMQEEIKEIESRKISKAEKESLEAEKESKEQELKDCIKQIEEEREKLVSETEKDKGYEQDTSSIAKKLDANIANKKYIEEKLEEINANLVNKIVIEDSIEAIEELEYRKARLNSFTYDNIEEFEDLEEKEETSEVEEKEETSEVEEKEGTPEVEEIEEEPEEKEGIPEVEKIEVEQETNSNIFKKQADAEFIDNKIKKIRICPREDKIYVEDYEEELSSELNYQEEYFECEEIQNIVRQCEYDFGIDLDEEYKVLDPAILSALKNDKEMLHDYVYAVIEKKDLPFELEYDLRNMDYSETLDEEEKENLTNIANEVKYVEGAKVSKDNPLTKIWSKIKSKIFNRGRKQIPEKTDSESEREKRDNYIRKLQKEFAEQAKEIREKQGNANKVISDETSLENDEKGHDEH